MKKIFICYSHEDEKWKDRVGKFLQPFKLDIWSDNRIGLGENWFEEIKKAIEESDAAILIVTIDFLNSRFIKEEEIPRFLEQRIKNNFKIFPLLVRECPWKKNEWLNSINMRIKDGKPLAGYSYHKIDSILTEFAMEIDNILNPSFSDTNASKEKDILTGPQLIDISRMPETSSDVYGRSNEILHLDEAWYNENIRVIVFKAWGGVGKTALVNHWLNIMQSNQFYGANRVYAWSFYSQGDEEGKQTSTDMFFNEILDWFCDSVPLQGSIVEKARRLARLISKQKTLLILDGLEPLQYPPGEPSGFEGHLKDPGLKTLLKQLTTDIHGLLVINTREDVKDLKSYVNYSVRVIELEHLSDDAALELLKKSGVKGTEKEILKTVREYDGHALALTLLGNYLAEVYDGDIRKRDSIRVLSDDRSKGKLASRVMESYEQWLKGKPGLDILLIMGLFDRPTPMEAINELLHPPVIPGVTDALQMISPTDFKVAISNLRKLGLLAGGTKKNKETSWDKIPADDFLDCHPLIREHFGKKLREQNREGWEKANERLYHHYKDLPEKELPDKMEDMESLYAAVAHGCRAGLYQSTFDDVYWKRIQREKDRYSIRMLGMYGSDITALSHFFDELWDHPVTCLNDFTKATILNCTGYCFRGLGRLYEAVQPMHAGLEMYIAQKDWVYSARAASSLSALYLAMGKLEKAVRLAEQSIEFADQSDDELQKEGKRTSLANALHYMGELNKAEELFLEAEAMQQKRQPEYQYLCSLRGYRFCDLLLSQGRYKEVITRAEKFIEWRLPSHTLLAVAFETLAAGRAWQMHAMCTGNSEDFKKAEAFLNSALEGLQKSGAQHRIPLALIARASYYRFTRDYEKAREDLAELKEIAELGTMELYLADYHLEAGRVCQAEEKLDEANEHFREANILIDKMGYGLRKKDIEYGSS